MGVFGLGDGVQHAGPAAHAFVEAAKVVFFVGRVNLIVVEAKANQHAVEPQNVFEIARNRDRAAAAEKGGLVRPFRRERMARGVEGGVFGRHDAGGACAVVFECGGAIGRQHVLHHLAERFADCVWVLGADKAEADFGRGFGWQDGFETVAGVAACDAVYLAGGARPELFKCAIALFAGQLRQADLGQERLFVEAERLPLGFDLGGEFRHAFVETGHGDAACVVVQSGDDAGEDAGRVDGCAAEQAGVQVFVGPGDRDFFAEKATQHCGDRRGVAVEKAGVTDQRQIGF